MKFKAIITRELLIPELGRVKPGQEFDVTNEQLLPLFREKTLFEEIKPVTKKVEVKKEKDGD